MQKRLISPGGLFLGLICFSFTFLTVSCETSAGTGAVEYSGWDFVFGGVPDTTGLGHKEDPTGLEEGDNEERVTVGPQLLAVLAFLTIIGGIALTLLPRVRAQHLANIGTSAMAFVLLLTNQLALHDQAVSELQKAGGVFARLADNVSSGFGFWAASAFLLAVTGYNAYELFQKRQDVTPSGAALGSATAATRSTAPTAPAGPGSATGSPRPADAESESRPHGEHGATGCG